MDTNTIVPASPCDNELEKVCRLSFSLLHLIREQDTTKTVFLLAGYARYRHPYVWVRKKYNIRTRYLKHSNLIHGSCDPTMSA